MIPEAMFLRFLVRKLTAYLAITGENDAALENLKNIYLLHTNAAFYGNATLTEL